MQLPDGGTARGTAGNTKLGSFVNPQAGCLRYAVAQASCLRVLAASCCHDGGLLLSPHGSRSLRLVSSVLSETSAAPAFSVKANCFASDRGNSSAIGGSYKTNPRPP